MPTLEWFYDYSCPYAYLASTRVRALAERTGADLVYKPFLLGGVFRGLGSEPMASLSPVRARMNGIDMQRWARHFDVPLVMPMTHPNRTVLALRATLASDDLPRATHALFHAYWVEALNLSDPEVVANTLTRGGFDGPGLVNSADSRRDELRTRTDEALARGVFGAPAFFVNGELHWGQDRMQAVERALGGTPPRRAAESPRSPAHVDFWYDFASPFAYLASTEIEALAARAGATLRFRPFLLGALFKAIGTPDVPLLGFPEAKRRYYELDLQRGAKECGVGLSFPPRFPIRTVLPLRVACMTEARAPERLAPFIHAVFRAAWADGRDIEDEAVLRELARAVGVDAGVVDAARSDEAKQRLRESTDEALRLELPGAPCAVVDGQVYWGRDRLELVERALGRDCPLSPDAPAPA
ncbi:MAG: 2-hydroxychromene-2-carboxylate isomerase [Polyangiaceae bacterium]